MTQEMTTFSHKVIEALDIIMEQEGNDALLNIEEIEKNGSIKVGISFKSVDDPVAPVVYLEKFLEEFNEGEKELEDIAYDVYDTYVDGTRESKKFEDLHNMFAWNNAKHNLIVQVVSPECDVTNIPHRTINDLKLIVRMIVKQDVNGISTTKVHNELLKMFGVSEETLFDTAYDCMKVKYPSKVRDMIDVIAEEHGLENLPPFMEETKGRMYVVSNSIKVNGAIYGFDKILLKAFCTVKDIEEVYILPSSISECIWIPGDKNVEQDALSIMVDDINNESVDPEDRLSNHAYKYIYDTDEIVSI